MKSLNARRLKIASGQAGLSDDKVRAYRRRWEKQGYALPEWNGEPATEAAAKTVTKANPPPEDGPGTEYELLAKEFGVKPVKSCSCTSLKSRMNRLGVHGCRNEREDLIQKLKENYTQLSLADKAKALVTGGLPAWMNPLDPVASMFEEAVRRAEQKPMISQTPAPRITVKPSALDNVTACITHFRRPDSLSRLQASMNRFYPDLKTEIEDTGGNLSAARNRLYARVQTPYILMLEEDFVFTPQTKIEQLLNVLESHPGLGGVGGCTHEPQAPGTVGRGGRIFWDRDFVRLRDRCHLAKPRRPMQRVQGIRNRHCDIVINFGVFRKQMFEQVPWDEQLPVQEHTDWYWRVYLDARWHFAYCPDVVIDHLRDRPGTEYNSQRSRDFSAYLKEKHGFRFIRDNVRPQLNVPNAVVLGTGRCNSTLITQQAIQAFGFNFGNVDKKYYEHQTVRAINQQLLNTGEFDALWARRTLRSLPQPWILKDPRWRKTLPHWIGVLKEFDPLLVYLVKDKATVQDSYARQGWHYDPKDHQRCDDHFAAWEGKKLKIDVARLGQACALFDPSRLLTQAEN